MLVCLFACKQKENNRKEYGYGSHSDTIPCFFRQGITSSLEFGKTAGIRLGRW